MEDIQYNKKSLAIIGAGGLGREMYSWISQTENFKNLYEFQGFIDDDLDKLKKFNYNQKIIASLKNNDFSEFDNILIAISNLLIKHDIYSILNVKRNKIIGFIHDTTLIGLNCVYEKCLITLPNVIISCDVILGKGVYINNGSQIGHDVQIGDFVNIMANVDIGGNCTIGNYVTIGSGATILPGLKIPDNTVIGAGAVVFRNIKDSGTYVGNPAKRIF